MMLSQTAVNAASIMSYCSLALIFTVLSRSAYSSEVYLRMLFSSIWLSIWPARFVFSWLVLEPSDRSLLGSRLEKFYEACRPGFIVFLYFSGNLP